jgi:hypothetical protein
VKGPGELRPSRGIKRRSYITAPSASGVIVRPVPGLAPTRGLGLCSEPSPDRTCVAGMSGRSRPTDPSVAVQPARGTPRPGRASHRNVARYAARARVSASLSSSFGMWAPGRWSAGSRRRRASASSLYLAPVWERSGAIGVPVPDCVTAVTAVLLEEPAPRDHRGDSGGCLETVQAPARSPSPTVTVRGVRAIT